MQDKFSHQATFVLGALHTIGYGPDDGMDLHDGSIQAKARDVIAAALREAAGGTPVPPPGPVPGPSTSPPENVIYSEATQRPVCWACFDVGKVIERGRRVACTACRRA